MKLKLFTVLIEAEVVVLAKDRAEAAQIARAHRRELLDSDYEIWAKSMCYLPTDWELDEAPWGSRETLGKLISEGAAPEYEGVAAKLPSKDEP